MIPRNLKRKFAVGWVLILLILNAGKSFAGSPIWAPEPLNHIIDDALSHNQEIKSIKSLIKSIEAESEFVSSLPDPKVGIGILNLPVNSYRLDQEPMTQKQLFISQKFPWFGKLDLKTKQVMLKAHRLKALLQAKQLEISRNIADQYYNLEFYIYSLSINRQLQEILAQSVEVAETRYATGRGLQPDIFQGQVEISRLEEEKLRLQKMKQVAQSRILALMNQENSDLLEQSVDRIVFPDIQLDSKKIHLLAYHHNPMLKAKEAEIDQSKIGVKLAKKDSYPDFDVKLAYGQRDENQNGNDWSDFFSASVSMNIPVWKENRQDKKVTSRLAEKKSMEQSYQNLFAMLPHRIDAVISEIKNNRASYNIYTEKLISQTQEWALSALAAYEVGKIEFSTMINARMRVLRSQLQAKKILFDVYKNRAELEELVGTPIPDIEKNHAGDMNHE
jgi:cobalt-zinc-cadmium efflux system outer membrane protein